MTNELNIVEIIEGAGVKLRRGGREYRALCPFHAEKTASFTVNPDKNLFYCHGCHEGGDAIRFIERLHHVGFREAVTILGLEDDYKPKPIDTHKRSVAAMLARWLNDQHLKVGALLRELSQEIASAEQSLDAELVELLNREWGILSDIHEDLQRPEFAADFLEAKSSIEALTAHAPVEPLPEFSLWTDEYRERLVAHLPEVIRC